MDFTLSNEQRAWQMTARKFAEEEIRPISLERDEIADPRGTFDWEIIKKGSKLGFRTVAVPKEWGGHGDEWILNGEKCFIANASVGKLFFIDARTDPNAPLRQGTTMFLVPRDTPGFRIGKVFNKDGWRFYQNGEMIFENARVPHANVVGAVNGSDMKTHQAGDRTGGDLFGDLELAANALGVCDDACQMALTLARTKQQGGRP